MAKLDLDWLGVFVEVYKTQSVTRAAERLGVEQASASIVLNKLRHHFGDRLFTRTSRGMEPTPAPRPSTPTCRRRWPASKRRAAPRMCSCPPKLAANSASA